MGIGCVLGIQRRLPENGLCMQNHTHERRKKNPTTKNQGRVKAQNFQKHSHGLHYIDIWPSRMFTCGSDWQYKKSKD